VAKFQGIAGKIADNASQTSLLAGPNPANSNSDTDVWGGEINTDKVIPAGNLAAYYYTKQIKKQAIPVNPTLGNNTLIVYGARLTGDVKPLAGLSYKAEFLANGGRNNSLATATADGPGYNGDAYFLGVNFGHDLAAMPARAHLEYGRGTDNFAAIAPSARFGLIWGEQTTTGPSTINPGKNGTVASLSNLKVLDAGVGINPIAKLGVDLNWYRFQYAAYTGGLGTSAGDELDLILSWKHSDNVSFEVNAAEFRAGQALDNVGVPTNSITRLGADVKIKF